MPVEVNLLENRGVEILATGVVYGHEIIKANEEIIKNKNLENISYKLIDKSACTEYAVTADDIKKVAELNLLVVKSNPNIIIAFVESEHLRYSLTNLWQAHFHDSYLKNRKFNKRKEALNWINNHLIQPDKKN